MPYWDYSKGYAFTTDDAEILDGTELVRGEGIPPEWFEGDSIYVDLSSGKRVLFFALPDRGANLFVWGEEKKPSRLARLERVNATTLQVHLVLGEP